MTLAYRVVKDWSGAFYVQKRFLGLWISIRVTRCDYGACWSEREDFETKDEAVDSIIKRILARIADYRITVKKRANRPKVVSSLTLSDKAWQSVHVLSDAEITTLYKQAFK